MSTDVTYVVKKTTAVLMDEANPPVATPIKEGQTLSESIISGGTMKNPYNEKLNLSSKVWSWVEPTQVITESGEYLAKWEGDTRAYEDITDYIYVEVEKDQKATALKTITSSVRHLSLHTKINTAKCRKKSYFSSSALGRASSIKRLPTIDAAYSSKL